MGGERQTIDPVGIHGDTDEAPTILGHEINRLGGDPTGGHDQIAFIFPTFVIHHHNHLATGNGFNGVFYRIKRVSHRGASFPFSVEGR